MSGLAAELAEAQHKDRNCKWLVRFCGKTYEYIVRWLMEASKEGGEVGTDSGSPRTSPLYHFSLTDKGDLKSRQKFRILTCRAITTVIVPQYLCAVN